MSHRAALFSALRQGMSHFTNFNLNDDCAATLNCLQKMGVKHKLDGDSLTITGQHPANWNKPAEALDAGNSGTTARLLSGILAGLKFETTLTGDASLSKRPMDRVISPLQKMGAHIESFNGFLPLTFKPVEKLKAITYQMPVASAQVKSAVLLAGLFAAGETRVIEKKITRDHTERMLGLKTVGGLTEKMIIVSQKSEIPDISMKIPGDFSSAAFFLSAALIVPGSKLTIRDVSLNPTRSGYLEVLGQMGAKIEYNIEKENPEQVGSIVAEFSDLKNITIPLAIVPNIIDEIPILALVATQASGKLILRNAAELRVKESDRIKTIVNNMKNLGVGVEEFEDGFSISGPQKINGGPIITQGDHRIAMTFAIAKLVANGPVVIDNPQCVSVSFPEFYETLNAIQKNG